MKPIPRITIPLKPSRRLFWFRAVLSAATLLIFVLIPFGVPIFVGPESYFQKAPAFFKFITNHEAFWIWVCFCVLMILIPRFPFRDRVGYSGSDSNISVLSVATDGLVEWVPYAHSFSDAISGKIIDGCVVAPFFVIVAWRDDEDSERNIRARKHHLMLLPDMMLPDEWRQLRVILKAGKLEA
jgi:hypothetical protein